MLQYRYETIDLDPEEPFEKDETAVFENEAPADAALGNKHPAGAASKGAAPMGAATEGAAPAGARAEDASASANAGAPHIEAHGAGCGCATGASPAPECMPDEELLYDLADLFKAFADTTRIRILYALMGQDRCVADIAEIIGVSQSAVSHQLRTLKQARLVKFQRDGKNIIYSLSDDHVYTMLAQGMTHICE